jgi:hypothetical protein
VCIFKTPHDPSAEIHHLLSSIRFFRKYSNSQSDTERKKKHHFDAQAILVMRRIPSARKTIQGPCRVFSRSRWEFRRHDEKEKKKKKRRETKGRVIYPETSS